MVNLGYIHTDYFSSFDGYLVPTMRYYFGSSKTQPFILIGYGFGFGFFKTNGNDDELNENFKSYGGLAGGLSHFINRNIALELKVGYSDAPITIYRGLFMNFGFQIFLSPRQDEE